MTDQFQNFDGTLVNSVDVNYQGADGSFLGNEYSRNDESGFRIEKLVSVTDELAWLDFDGDGTDGETGISAIEMIFEEGRILGPLVIMELLSQVLELLNITFQRTRVSI